MAEVSSAEGSRVRPIRRCFETALIREFRERRRAECRADIQMEVVKLALDLLVREPDIEGFFGGSTKTMVEESGSHTCAVWLLDEDAQRCTLWLAYIGDRLFVPPKSGAPPCGSDGHRQAVVSVRATWRRTSSVTRRDGIRPSSTRETMTACRSSCGSSPRRWAGKPSRDAAAFGQPQSGLDDGVEPAMPPSPRISGGASS